MRGLRVRSGPCQRPGVVWFAGVAWRPQRVRQRRVFPQQLGIGRDLRSALAVHRARRALGGRSVGGGRVPELGGDRVDGLGKGHVAGRSAAARAADPVRERRPDSSTERRSARDQRRRRRSRRCRQRGVGWSSVLCWREPGQGGRVVIDPDLGHDREQRRMADREHRRWVDAWTEQSVRIPVRLPRRWCQRGRSQQRPDRCQPRLDRRARNDGRRGHQHWHIGMGFECSHRGPTRSRVAPERPRMVQSSTTRSRRRNRRRERVVHVPVPDHDRCIDDRFRRPVQPRRRASDLVLRTRDQRDDQLPKDR